MLYCIVLVRVAVVYSDYGSDKAIYLSVLIRGCIGVVKAVRSADEVVADIDDIINVKNVLMDKLKYK